MFSSYTYTSGGRSLTRAWARTGTDDQPIVTTYTYASCTTGKPGRGGDLIQVQYSSNDPQNTPGITYTFDRRGRQATVTRNGVTTTLAYNNASQLLSESYSGSPLDGLSVASAYDNYLRRTNVSLLNSQSSILASTASGYDAASRLHAVTDLSGATRYSATYSYLANSPLVSQIAFQQNGAAQMTTAEQYDNLNRLTNIASTRSSAPAWPTLSGESFGYTYNSANQRTRTALADGSYWRYSYDSLGQVISGNRYWTDGTEVPGQQFLYFFDDIGNRQGTDIDGGYDIMDWQSWFNDPGYPCFYSANNLNQYTSRNSPPVLDILGAAFPTNAVTVNGQAASYRKGEYFYEQLSVDNLSGPVWEPVSVSVANQTVTGNVFVPPNNESYTYDSDGNLLSDGRWNYTWDAENRLVGMAVNTGTVGPQISLQFDYDWKGRRIRKQVWPNATCSDTPTNDTAFVYDGWNLICELNTLNSSSLIRSYVWGLDLSGSAQGAGGVGGLLFVRDCASAVDYCVGHDGNGNVAALVNMNDDTVAAQYEYGPFGEVIRTTGPMAKVNPFRFSTKHQDAESDLIYYGYRYYNATTGRWVSRDPFREKGGLNLYCFLSNGSVNRIDKLGLCICGPNVTAALANTIKDVERAFAAPGTDQESVCDNFNSAGGWEITGLVTHQYTKACGEAAPCDQTVVIGGQCYFAYTVNYVLYGTMCRLCHFSQSEMGNWITLWKVPKRDGQWGQALSWAYAGYDGWPHAFTPASGRPNCPNCSINSKLKSFKWHAGGMRGGSPTAERP